MSERTSRLISSGGLVVGSALGMVGTFVPSAAVRGLLWGLDGVALIVELHFSRFTTFARARILLRQVSWCSLSARHWSCLAPPWISR